MDRSSHLTGMDWTPTGVYTYTFSRDGGFEEVSRGRGEGYRETINSRTTVGGAAQCVPRAAANGLSCWRRRYGVHDARVFENKPCVRRDPIYI